MELKSLFQGIADAIRAKDGTSEPIVASTFPERIQAIPAGGGSGEEWIGDGNTHIWIHLEEGRTSPMLGCCPNGTVTVDWGDGTAPDTLTGTSISTVKWTPTHNYAQPGDYIITLTVDGEVGFSGGYNTNDSAYILRHASGADDRNLTYSQSIRKAEIGSGAILSGGYAFADCTGLTGIKIPAGVTSIGEGAFYRCISLTSVAIPDSVTSIGNYAFFNCYGVRFYDFTTHTSIPTLTIANTFTGISADCEIRVPGALYIEWKAATNWVTYADHIVGVGFIEELAYTLSADGTYYSVTGIGTCGDTGIIIPAEYEGKPVTAIGDEAFMSNASITSVIIPNSVTSIGEGAFDSCTSLASVTIGDGVTSIGLGSFYGCTSLTSVTIPNSVTSIGTVAFSGCTGLTSVTIGNGVTFIGRGAFGNCYSVAFYDFTSHTSIPTLENTNAFTAISDDCEIRVPAALYDEWVAATNWATYADHIVGVGVAIPSEYQQVEYIEGTGTQLIDNVYTVKSDYLEIKSRIFTTVKRAEMSVFGSNKTLEAGFSTTLDRMFVYSSGSSKSLGGIFNNIYDNIIDFNAKFYPSGRTVSVNDETVSDDINHNLTGEVIRLFGYYGTAYKFKGRVYSFQIFDNYVLVVDFVPCYRKSDHAIGMYDRVSKAFFTNQGTGNFAVGTDV